MGKKGARKSGNNDKIHETHREAGSKACAGLWRHPGTNSDAVDEEKGKEGRGETGEGGGGKEVL